MYELLYIGFNRSLWEQTVTFHGVFVKIKFLLASIIDWFERRFKEICPSVHFRNLYWCLFQDLSTNRVKRQDVSPLGESEVLVVGAPYQADVNDPYIQEIASSALAEIDGRSNAVYKQKVLRIAEARKQVWLLLICIIAVVYCIVHYSKIPWIRYSWYWALEADISQLGISYVTSSVHTDCLSLSHVTATFPAVSPLS